MSMPLDSIASNNQIFVLRNPTLENDFSKVREECEMLCVCTEYKWRSIPEEAPRETDDSTAINYVLEENDRYSDIFNTARDRTDKTNDPEMPTHLQRMGWKVILLSIEQLQAGDIIWLEPPSDIEKKIKERYLPNLSKEPLNFFEKLLAAENQEIIDRLLKVRECFALVISSSEVFYCAEEYQGACIQKIPEFFLAYQAHTPSSPHDLETRIKILATSDVGKLHNKPSSLQP